MDLRARVVPASYEEFLIGNAWNLLVKGKGTPKVVIPVMPVKHALFMKFSLIVELKDGKVSPLPTKKNLKMISSYVWASNRGIKKQNAIHGDY